ncbi:MAG: hypothetical protein GDA37_06035 [Ekhidna sp.]|nr:hypothetical protein [Ekhidna sp.]
MPSEKLYRELRSLDRKIHLLLSENKRLRDELTQSQSENRILQSRVESQKANLDSVQNQMKMSKMVDNMIVGEEDSAKLKRQIDGYIKELDKCIAHLAE